MELNERDKFTGHMTTGHEWNGIKELNSPVPRVVWLFLGVFATFGIIWTLLMPSWPGVSGYFRGLLGVDHRVAVEQTISEAAAEKAAWLDRIASEDFDAIGADGELMAVVRDTGKALFADNCAACHSAGGTGNAGYPSIAAAPMMWGEDPETIAETIRVGINSTHPETRYAQMLAFGRDGMLGRAEIDAVVAYVETLSDPAIAEAQPEPVATGERLFADNCAGCHGVDAKGMVETGAPDLTDPFWTYGGDRRSIRTSVYGGRQGVMPSWEARFSPAEIKLLALYVLDLREGRQ
ncbi:cytochrome-c oxidase, cbb3-type subunit III [Devosia nitrariae]|uniref:Cbb3-type cytochrome c oxidase subunit n=1 Tax=Devosia nitrariae TaxID=2071872 RepID=A0ABQ5W9F1_9HYPH|nr:cytochrome-c oxidase, cbb3-type subunit III [Devosia nitrariae]GLQ56607.1 Cbb3-type cytochrome c oxidase subunit [Devosia nitrariae]